MDFSDLDFGETLRGMREGQRVFKNRYTLTKQIGRGGMGVVWLARDEELERDVALKFLPEIIARDEASIKDMKRETRRALDMTHANIVRIYDFLTDDSRAGISMEYVDGRSLAEMRADRDMGHLEVSDVEPLVEQLCRALDYAHKVARVAHRDLKPANLMVNQDGELKITDFGISASLSDSRSRVSVQSSSSGTPVYMSPQQMMGEDPAPSDDIYSLGATVYELLTGKPPFYTGNILLQVQHKAPPSMMKRRKSLDKTGGDVPATWEAAIAACLSKEPEGRPKDAAVLLAALRGEGLQNAESVKEAENKQAKTNELTDEESRSVARSETKPKALSSSDNSRSDRPRTVLYAIWAIVAMFSGGAAFYFGFPAPSQERVADLEEPEAVADMPTQAAEKKDAERLGDSINEQADQETEAEVERRAEQKRIADAEVARLAEIERQEQLAAERKRVAEETRLAELKEEEERKAEAARLEAERVAALAAADDKAFEDAKRINTVDSLRSYIDGYSRHSDEATVIYEELLAVANDEAAFAKAASVDTAESYSDYLVSYPNGLHSDQAAELVTLRTPYEISWQRDYWKGSAIDAAASVDSLFVVGSERKGMYHFNALVDNDLWAAKLGADGRSLWKLDIGKNKRAEALNDIAIASDGGLFILMTQTKSTDSQPFLMKIDSQGKKLWERSVGGSQVGSRGVAIVAGSDGGCLVVRNFFKGTVLRVMKMHHNSFASYWDARGKKRWESEYGEDAKHELAQQAISLETGVFRVFGSAEGQGWALDFTESEGFIREVPASEAGIPPYDKSALTQDGGVIAHGDDAFIVKRNRAGGVQWRLPVAFVPSRIVANLAGEFYAIGNHEGRGWVAKLTP